MMSDGLRTFLGNYGLYVFWSVILILDAVTLNPLFFIGIPLLWGFVGLLKSGWALPSWLRGKPKPRKEKPYREPKPHMTVEMVKAFKNRHCPLVEWED